MPVAPQISLLLPVRNGAATLHEALDSLAQQTFRDWECVIVDDGSRDETAEICRRWTRCDPRFVLHSLLESRGVAGALQHAASHARGALLGRQDADDRSRADRLARQIDYLHTHPRCVAVASRVHLFPPEALTPGLRAYARWLDETLTPDQIAREIWVESPLPHPAALMRREAFEACGGYRQGPWPEDYDLWLRLHLRGGRLGKVDACLYDWRHHLDRLTFRDPRYSPAAFLDCKLQHLLPALSGRPLRIWGAGRDGRRLLRALRDRGADARAFVDIDPRKIGRTRLGLPVESPRAIDPSDVRERHEMLLVAVGTRGARALIRARLERLGLHELDDFICLH
ncbi:MAG: glycosyltransferase [Candidatus Eisenbacteria bacterium]|nr:glycosyltransferase [Candidatus Eisenbacteria bacterium]